MSWLSDIGDSLGITTDLKLADQKSWLEPLISAGTGYLTQRNENNAQKDYLNYLKQQEQQNYDDSVAQINAYNAAHGAGGGGGGGGGAARANEAKRYKAAKKSNKYLQNTYKQILGMYAPFKQTAETLLPQMSQTYQNSLGLQNALAQYINSPQQVAKLDAAGPAWNVNVPLPDYLRGQ